MRHKPSYREEINAKLRANRERAALWRAVLMFVAFLVALIGLTWAMGMAFGAELSPSTGKVAELDSEATTKAYGSGVLVAKFEGHGYVLTARHVAVKYNGNRLVVYFPKSRRFAYAAHAVLNAPGDIDLAMLQIDAPADIAPRPIRWEPLIVGEKVWQSGYGDGRCGTREWWSNVLPNVTRTEYGDKVEYTTPSLLMLSRPSVQGDSGGPIIDAKGRVAGICTATDKNRGYHVTLADQDWLRELLPAQEHSIVVK